MNIFEKASRDKLRYSTQVGQISVEDLWDLPLQNGSNGLDLDHIAKTCNKLIKHNKEESFVESPTPADEELELKFEIVKHVISVKITERDEAKEAKAKKEKKEKLLGLLAEKQDEELKGKSTEELQAMIADL